MHGTTWRRRLLRFPAMFIAAALIAGTGLAMMPATTAAAITLTPLPPPSLCDTTIDGTAYNYATTEFGPEVCLFTPPSGANAANELAAVQMVLNNIATQQVPVSAQFNDTGYALLFEGGTIAAPATYGSATTPLVFQVGYYTEVAGLGAVPQDTVINGQIEVFANVLDSEPGPANCGAATCYWANSDDNFWRSMSNLTLNVMTNGTPDYTPTPLSVVPTADGGVGNTGADGCFASPGPLGSNTDLWSSSQASPVRSMIINGNLNWQQYCSETNYTSNDFASGSYVANSEIKGTVTSATYDGVTTYTINGQLDWSGNQQGIARNTDFQGAEGYVWNYVYSGDACPPGYTPPATDGGVTVPTPACAPTEDAFNNSYDIGNWLTPPCVGANNPSGCTTPGVPQPGGPPGTDGINAVNQITELPASPVTEEEPFLYTNSTGTTWGAFVPAAETGSVGPNFLNGSEAGTSVPWSSFFVASPTTPEPQIQGALDAGQNLVLTPGTYDLKAPITVWHPDTVVIGLGFPVLVPQQGNAALVVVPNNGVKLSGMIVDAGPVNSPVLVSVGTSGFDWGGGFPGTNNANDPDLIQDVYFRVGGAETTPVSATISLLDNASNSIIDDIWAWRADHGASTVTGPEGQQGAGWTYNQGQTGLEVTGNNVTAYGLAVEHYQQNEVIWSGNGGTAIYLQNELPYDPPTQSAWAAGPAQAGYPAFLVTNNVQTFKAYGFASYVVFIDTPATLWDAMAYEAPNTPGVQFTDAMDLFISSTCSVNGSCTSGCTPGSCIQPFQSGGDGSVIDGVGGPATNENVTTPVDVDSYSNWAGVLPTH